VLGATGFIGGGVARAFAIRGYTVTALARTEEKAKQLRTQEITPIVGKAQEPKTWEAAALAADIIVEALADYQDHSTASIVQKALIEILSKHKNKVVIATSGVWVYGTTTHPVDENSPGNPPDIVKGRVPWENTHLSAGVIVVRPGLLYGYQGSITASLFKQLKEGKSGEFPGHANAEIYWSTIHLDDLSDAYVRIAERGLSLRGELFNLVSQAENLKGILHGIARAANFKGEIKFVEPKDPFSTALALSQEYVSNAKAKHLLGWSPNKPSLLAGADKYYRTWESLQ
jgi:nucleoside-diphosphate-sugar epimerase